MGLWRRARRKWYPLLCGFLLLAMSFPFARLLFRALRCHTARCYNKFHTCDDMLWMPPFPLADAGTRTTDSEPIIVEGTSISEHSLPKTTRSRSHQAQNKPDNSHKKPQKRSIKQVTQVKQANHASEAKVPQGRRQNKKKTCKIISYDPSTKTPPRGSVYFANKRNTQPNPTQHNVPHLHRLSLSLPLLDHKSQEVQKRKKRRA